jgi:murein L,D-transpeptidase YcbB/YkuD
MRLIRNLILTGLAFYSCANKNGSSPIMHIPRDTSITEKNAYTNLVLDSHYVETFIHNGTEAEDIAARIRNFYNSRNYQFAWFDEDGLTEQGKAFWNLHEMRIDKLSDSTLYSKELHGYMQVLLNEDTTINNYTELKEIELRLTHHFFQYLNTVFKGKVSPEEMQWHIPRRKINEQAILDSFLANGQKGWMPLNQSFSRMQNKLIQFVSFASSGDWPTIQNIKGTLKKGSVNEIVTQIKKRLIMAGDYLQEDTTAVFNDSLRNAVLKVQRLFGLKETGVIDATIIERLNVPLSERIKQLKINLERMRWMPEESPDRLVVNIPDFKLYVYERGEKHSSMNIVVGKAANKTVIFSDELEYIVFSPYWNIPRSITRNEILPEMNANSRYLEKNNMEITGYNNGLPVIRQKPGRGNALGKVKFIFPNRYNIYLHDTPTRNLFNRERRTFSHGCIRLQKPFELAKYLLRNDTSWTDKKIKISMNQGSEQWVKLEKAIPVFIVYFTAWVDESGLVHFREDVYGHDKRMERHLFD